MSSGLSPARVYQRLRNPADRLRPGSRGEPRVRLLASATRADFFREFARAEVHNDARHNRAYSRGLGLDLFARVRSGDMDGIDRKGHSLIRSTVISTRPTFLRPLLRLGLRWSYGDLSPSGLSRLRVPDLDIFRHTAPSRCLGDFVLALDRGEGGVWRPLARNYGRMRSRFDPRRMVGVPIVVGATSRGPFTVVEGLTRLSILVSRLGRGEPVPRRIRALIGLGPKAENWKFF